MYHHTSEDLSFRAAPDSHQMRISYPIPCCVQDQGTAHKLWLAGLKMLLVLHMICRTMLHKAAPRLCGGPRMMEVMQGTLPYRRFMAAIYQDGIAFAGFLTAVSAIVLQLI